MILSSVALLRWKVINYRLKAVLLELALPPWMLRCPGYAHALFPVGRNDLLSSGRAGATCSCPTSRTHHLSPPLCCFHCYSPSYWTHKDVVVRSNKKKNFNCGTANGVSPPAPPPPPPPHAAPLSGLSHSGTMYNEWACLLGCIRCVIGGWRMGTG